jgi:hypothetical protein
MASGLSHRSDVLKKVFTMSCPIFERSHSSFSWKTSLADKYNFPSITLTFVSLHTHRRFRAYNRHTIDRHSRLSGGMRIFGEASTRATRDNNHEFRWGRTRKSGVRHTKYLSILCRRNPLLGNDSVNAFSRRSIRVRIGRLLVGNGSVNVTSWQ